MSLNPDIKKLCDKSLEKLFSLKGWEKIKNKKRLKGTTDPLYSEIDGKINIFVIYKLYLNNC